MDKELPYFKFSPAKFLSGTICLQDEKTIGVFTILMSLYWQRDCIMTLAYANQKLSNCQAEVKQLISSGIIKHNTVTDCIEIVFLNEQFSKFTGISKTRSITGFKGGKAKAKQLLSKSQPIDNIQDKTRQDKKLFNEFRELYGGTKRGNDTEFDNFCKKHRDWEQALPLLTPALLAQINERDVAAATNKFYPEWKHLSTWVNQRCWENTTTTLATPNKAKLTTTPAEYKNLYTEDGH